MLFWISAVPSSSDSALNLKVRINTCWLNADEFKCQTVSENDTNTHWRLVQNFECQLRRLTGCRLRRSLLANQLLGFAEALLLRFAGCGLGRVAGGLRQIVNGAGSGRGRCRWNFLAEYVRKTWSSRRLIFPHIAFLVFCTADLVIGSEREGRALQDLVHSVVASIRRNFSFCWRILSGNLLRLRYFLYSFVNLWKIIKCVIGVFIVLLLVSIKVTGNGSSPCFNSVKFASICQLRLLLNRYRFSFRCHWNYELC